MQKTKLNMMEFIGFSVDPSRIFIHRNFSLPIHTYTTTIQYNSEQNIIAIIFLKEKEYKP